MISKILGLFVNTLTADEKYSHFNRENLLQHLEMQLSQKEKIFLDFLFAFSKLRFHFEHFQRKHDPHSSSFFELKDSEKQC